VNNILVPRPKHPAGILFLDISSPKTKNIGDSHHWLLVLDDCCSQALILGHAPSILNLGHTLFIRHRTLAREVSVSGLDYAIMLGLSSFQFKETLHPNI